MSSKNNSFNQCVEPRGHAGSSLSIHPYFGKVDPALACSLIENFSQKGDTVLDPFCGSGTVLHEALCLGRSAIGWDSSPLATLICASKLHGSSDKEKLIAIRDEILAEKEMVLGLPFGELSSFIPTMKRVRNVSKWFTNNTLKELAYIKSYLIKNRSEFSDSVNLFLTIAFSRIITSSSNQQGESSYRSISKDDTPGRIIHLYIKSINHVIKSAERFDLEFMSRQAKFSKKNNDYTIIYDESRVDICTYDSRSTQSLVLPKKASLVVSSPPYLMSWDYGLYHKFRFYWLGFDLDEYEHTEIGRHLRRKKDDVERYTSDMNSIFHTLNDALEESSKIALINAPSVVYGKLVNTNHILEECGESAGWKLKECVASLDIPGPHHGMYSSLRSRKASAPGEAGKKEHVLIFER